MDNLVAFFGKDAYSKCRPLIREGSFRQTSSTPHSLLHSDESMRIYAFRGDWTAVLNMAEKLEMTSIDRTKLLRCDYTEGDDTKKVQTAILAARLPYILVKVTAYVKMQRFKDAKKIIDQLGDLQGEQYHHIETKESIVPFSLRFLAAVIPHYCGDTSETTRKLYQLFSECRHAESLSLQKQEMGKYILWNRRLRRVQRALAIDHLDYDEHDTAIHLLQGLIDTDAGGNPTVSEQTFIRHIFNLQRFACLCLHSGDALKANRAMHRIKSLAVPQNFNAKIEDLRLFVCEMNRAFILVFNGKFEEASDIFETLSQQLDLCISRNERIGDQDLESNTNFHAPREELLINAAMGTLRSNVELSHITSLAYTQSKYTNTNLFSTIIETMESYIRRNPFNLVHSDGFIRESTRLYQLRNDTTKARKLVLELLNTFRCDSQSIPRFE